MSKTVIITGASSGIGEALAYAAVKRNYNVVLAARGEAKLAEVVNRCVSMGGKALGVTCDVSSHADCENLINSTIAHFGGMDILINNAGISMRALFKDCDLKVLESIMAVNFFGTVYCTKHAMPHLLKTKGTVVGISSIAGVKGVPGRTGYSASKFAMNGFLEALRIENLKTGLHVLIACPGYTASNIRNLALNKTGNSQTETPFDESKLMSPETVAEAIFRAIDTKRRYLYLTVQGKAIVILNKFFSGLLDKLVYRGVAKEKDSPL